MLNRNAFDAMEAMDPHEVILKAVREWRPPIDPRKTAFFVSDWQNDGHHPDGVKAKYYGKKRLRESRELLGPLRQALEKVRKLGIRVVYTRIINRKHGFGVNWRPRNMTIIGAYKEGSWGAEIIEELAPRDGDIIIDKFRYSAFFETGLDIILRRLGISTIVLAGGSTTGETNNNARDGEHRDYHVIVLSDLTMGPSKEAHKYALKEMERSFATIMTSQEFLEEAEMAFRRGKRRSSS